ncbi:MAG: hypothetical protein ABIM88_05990 [candidate division WOR-3 bacterium]
MSWIDRDEPISILLPVLDPALALPAAVTIARNFPKHRIFSSEEARAYINLYLTSQDDLSPKIAFDLSLPPETRPMPRGTTVGVTANSLNVSFNVLLRVRSDDPLRAREGFLSCLGLSPSETDWLIPQALTRAERHLERTGYYKGRLRVFFDSKDNKLELAIREIYGTDVMFIRPGETPPDETLMLLTLSDLYMGAGSVLTGFAFLFGKKCILTSAQRVPEGLDARPIGNLKRTLTRMGFL